MKILNRPIITEEQISGFVDLFGRGIDQYVQKDESVSTADWLADFIVSEIEGYDPAKALQDVGRIADVIGSFNNSMKEVDTAESNGISKGDWLASVIKAETEELSNEEQGHVIEAFAGAAESESILLGEAVNENPEGDFNREIDLEWDLEQDEEADRKKTYSKAELSGILKGVGRAVTTLSMQGALVKTGIDMAEKVIAGKQIKPNKVLLDLLASGDDDGLKMVTSGVLDIASKKGVLSAVPPETTIEVLSVVGSTAIENLKTIQEIQQGEVSVIKGASRMVKTTVVGCGALWKVTKDMKVTDVVSMIPAIGPTAKVVSDVVATTIGYKADVTLGQVVKPVGERIAKVVKPHVEAATKKIKKEVAKAFEKGIKQGTKTLGKILC